MKPSSKKKVEEQQNTFGWSLGQLEENAKRCKNAILLHDIAVECYNNKVICYYIANNRYISPNTLTLLAKHPDDAVRIIVAGRSYEIPCYDNINELSENDFDSMEDYEMAKVYNNILLKLAMDKCKKVREELSRTVKSEKIKKVLCKGNPSNSIIVGNCLRRSTDMKYIRKFILDASLLNSGEKLFLYSKDILLNKYLTSLELLTFIIYCPKLSEKHVQMIRKSNGFNRLVEVLLKENCPAA